MIEKQCEVNFPLKRGTARFLLTEEEARNIVLLICDTFGWGYPEPEGDADGYYEIVGEP